MASLITFIFFVLSLVLGILAIARPISEETIKKMEVNLFLKFTLAKQFKFSNKINKLMGESVRAGSLGGSLKFSLGMIMLFIYFFLINVVINFIKTIVYQIAEVWPPSYMEAFFLLFGAGITAYIIWIKNLYAEAKNMTILRKSGEKKKYLGTVFSRGLKMITLFITYLIWTVGETSFIFYSAEFKDRINGFLGFALIFFIILTIILFSSSVFSLAAKPSEPKKEI